MKLSKYFEWSEVTRTGTGIYNEPEGLELKSNIAQCAARMDEIRELIGLPIKINSWYRCPKVNAKVGGAKTSAHLTGWAVDFNVIGMSDVEAVSRIAASALKFDQLIFEPSWLHVSFAPAMRQQILTLKTKGGKYLPGIIL